MYINTEDEIGILTVSFVMLYKVLYTLQGIVHVYMLICSNSTSEGKPFDVGHNYTVIEEADRV